jgi:hypothetical protein
MVRCVIHRDCLARSGGRALGPPDAVE